MKDAGIHFRANFSISRRDSCDGHAFMTFVRSSRSPHVKATTITMDISISKLMRIMYFVVQLEMTNHSIYICM